MRLMLKRKRSRFIIGLTVILLTSFVSLSVLNYQSAKEAMKREITEASLPLLRDNIYSEIQSDILPALNISSAMANDHFLIKWAREGETDLEAILSYLERIQRQYGYFSTFFVSEATKTYYHFSGINKTISPDDPHDVWYYDFVASGKDYDLDVDNDEVRANTLTIFINYRLVDQEGRFLGVTGVGIEMQSFSKFLEQQQEKYDRTIFLTDREGKIQAHSDISLVEKVSIHDLPGLSKAADEVLATHDDPVDIQLRTGSGELLLTSRFIPEIEWILIVEMIDSGQLGGGPKILLRSLLIGIAASLLIILLVMIVINQYNQHLEEMALTDPLTGAMNRRAFQGQLDRAVYRRERYGIPVSVMLIDLDHFKAVNDTHGHPAGDRFLVFITELFGQIKRPDDILSRWGGDEFILLLEADGSQALILAERLRAGLEEQRENRAEAQGIPVTLSIGVAEMRDGEEAGALLHRADQALYQAKDEGRNRVVTAPDQDPA